MSLCCSGAKGACEAEVLLPLLGCLPGECSQIVKFSKKPVPAAKQPAESSKACIKQTVLIQGCIRIEYEIQLNVAQQGVAEGRDQSDLHAILHAIHTGSAHTTHTTVCPCNMYSLSWLGAGALVA